LSSLPPGCWSPRGLHLGFLKDVVAASYEGEAPPLLEHLAHGRQHVEQVHGDVERFPGQLAVAE
jgi:hypothetical protein